MDQITVKSPLQYLDGAMSTLRTLGLLEGKREDAPIVGLLEKIAEISPDQVAIITRTLQQMGVFNEVVREQVAEMAVGERYEKISQAFDSIRADAKAMVDQMTDGKLDFFERASNTWMKFARGDIAKRFDQIRKTYLQVAKDTKENIDREQAILDAYRDFRGALKHGEIAALEILKTAEQRLANAREGLQRASDLIAAFPETGDAAERARLELTRDEHLRHVQNEEGRYQVAKDLSDNLTIGYNTSDVVMARLVQTMNAKERIYQQAVIFFTTNESVLTALKASFTGLHGLHESTQTLNAMKEGVSKSLEMLADIGGKVQEEALKAGYGPTVRAEAVVKLVESVVNYQTRSAEIITEMRTLSSRNSLEIREAVEDGRKRVARLAETGNALIIAG